MGKNIKILVCAHKDSRLPQHEYFCPIQVGASLTSARFFPVLDNTGDNISDRNPHFCELTAHYWAWKNLNADYIGLCHYRRYFSSCKKTPKEENEKFKVVLTKNNSDSIGLMKKSCNIKYPIYFLVI